MDIKYICITGPRGSGKTTLAQLFPDTYKIVPEITLFKKFGRKRIERLMRDPTATKKLLKLFNKKAVPYFTRRETRSVVFEGCWLPLTEIWAKSFKILLPRVYRTTDLETPEHWQLDYTKYDYDYIMGGGM